MENWGLVTYRETALLYDPVVSSTGNKERVVTVIAHELAHMVGKRKKGERLQRWVGPAVSGSQSGLLRSGTDVEEDRLRGRSPPPPAPDDHLGSVGPCRPSLILNQT